MPREAVAWRSSRDPLMLTAAPCVREVVARPDMSRTSRARVVERSSEPAILEMYETGAIIVFLANEAPPAATALPMPRAPSLLTTAFAGR